MCQLPPAGPRINRPVRHVQGITLFLYRNNCSWRGSGWAFFYDFGFKVLGLGCYYPLLAFLDSAGVCIRVEFWMFRNTRLLLNFVSYQIVV